ncbi:MAG: virulence RhuM family protein, partial [Lachnospiraceae bacterium]|nr:virulence RhuM family protein [Lachnospiraceae bacterium]
MTQSNIIMYTTEDGVTKIEVTFDHDTVWLSIDQMAELFQRDKSVIGKHVRNIFKEGELAKEAVWAKFAYTASDGKTYQVDFYNLDVIISVGYRVKSLRGTQFRIWATSILKEYMKKGFALDDDRLKNLGGGNYFDELLARIRDIRSSEKVFWRKVLEIYATSIDYDPKAESSIIFFKQVQNKMHWAAHKHTAAEVIYQRADADKDNMGLTAWAGKKIKRSDVEVAKNYLSEKEIDALNKIVMAYLDIAEVHALNQEPMYMKDWLETIDDYLKMTRRDILTTKG